MVNANDLGGWVTVLFVWYGMFNYFVTVPFCVAEMIGLMKPYLSQVISLFHSREKVFRNVVSKEAI